MKRKVELDKYLPNYLQKYTQLMKITLSENPEFQLAMNQSESLKNNAFIEFCDEKGIARFEQIMDITPSSQDTLETRRSRVLTRWNEALPYTEKFLQRKLNSLCGINNYEINENFKTYQMNLKTYLDSNGKIEELKYLLESIVPANIKTKAFNEMAVEAEKNLIHKSTVVTLLEIGIASEIPKIEHFHEWTFIDTDFEEKYKNSTTDICYLDEYVCNCGAKKIVEHKHDEENKLSVFGTIICGECNHESPNYNYEPQEIIKESEKNGGI